MANGDRLQGADDLEHIGGIGLRHGRDAQAFLATPRADDKAFRLQAMQRRPDRRATETRSFINSASIKRAPGESVPHTIISRSLL